jgi:PiT family inorganic phosphate transporter
MIAAVGTDAIIWSGILAKVIIPALLAPFICGGVAILATRLAYGLTHSVSPEHTTRGFQLGQVASSSLVALAHGTNDAQKTMGVVTLTLVAGGRLGAGEAIPFWAKLACAVAIAAGTFSGGWRVIRTLGTRVTDVQAPQGFSAETASSSTILASSYFGFSLSTTQVVSGGIMGSGLGRAGGIVRWRVVRSMLVAWVLTIPAAGLMGACAHGGVEMLPSETWGVVVVGTLGLSVTGGLFLLARRTGHVNAGNVIEPVTAPVAAGAGA